MMKSFCVASFFINLQVFRSWGTRFSEIRSGFEKMMLMYCFSSEFMYFLIFSRGQGFTGFGKKNVFFGFKRNALHALMNRVNVFSDTALATFLSESTGSIKTRGSEKSRGDSSCNDKWIGSSQFFAFWMSWRNESYLTIRISQRYPENPWISASAP